MEEEKDVDRHSVIRVPFVDGCTYGNSVGDGREERQGSTLAGIARPAFTPSHPEPDPMNPYSKSIDKPHTTL